MTRKRRTRRRTKHVSHSGLASELERGRREARHQLSLQALLAGRGKPANLLALQRLAGNRATALAANGGRPVGLPRPLRAAAERASGIDLGDVGVHYRSEKPKQLAAAALSRGGDIHLGPGQGDHLPHELWHVVQQRQGRVTAEGAVKGVGVNADPALEHEAEAAGRSLPTNGTPTRRVGAKASSGAVAQFAEWDVGQLVGEVTRRGLSGVCNSMSTAWLLGVIHPGAMSPTGINDANWVNIRALKQLLDKVSALTKEDSDRATLAFVQYSREEGLDEGWFTGLRPANVNSEVEKFRQFAVLKRRKGEPAPRFENDEDEERQEDQDQHLKKGMDVLDERTDREDDENSYEDWSLSKIEEVIDAALENSFHLDANLEGVVSIKAKRVTDFRPNAGDFANHQFVIQYEGTARQLTILDQNAGLTVHTAITSDDMLSEVLAKYIHDNYVAVPMTAANGKTDEARIVVSIRSKDEAVEEEADDDEGSVAEGDVGEGAS